MDGSPPHVRVTADRGGIAVYAERDAYINCHNQVRYKPCPCCELRWIAPKARMCGACARTRRSARLGAVLAAAAGGFAVCFGFGLRLAHALGRADDVFFGLAAACALFGGGYWGWVRGDVLRHLQRLSRMLRHPRRLTRRLRRVPMFSRLRAAPTRRAPGSDEDTGMEPNAEAARLAKVYAEIDKLMAETARINAGTRWYSRIALAVVSLVMGIAAVKFLL